MKGIKLAIAMVVGICATIGCSKSKLGKREFIDWVKNPSNQLNQTKTIGDIQLNIQYTPGAYLELIQDGASDSKMQQYALEMVVLSKKNSDIAKHNISTISDYEARMQYMSFSMQNDIKLVDGDDTLDCKWFHFERGADIKPHRTWLLGFDKLQTTDSQTKVLLVDVSKLGAGIVKFKFDKNILTNIPTLKTSK